ncbi:MAG: GNAT family N-acetyltransferase [Candidatus Fimadaptatus sp.]
MQFVTPDARHEAAVLAYREAFRAAGEKPYGSGGLHRAASYAEWLSGLERGRAAAPGEGRAPQEVYLAMVGDELVGMLALRLADAGEALRYAGNVGYSVRPDRRRRGYATSMLRWALDRCRAAGLRRALLTCDRGNAASARTIMRCGGALAGELPEGDGIVEQYWIEL